MLIDIHIHLHPSRLFKAIRNWFNENEHWDFWFKHLEPEAVADHLRKQGVERFVFSSYAHKPGMARDLNSWLVETARELNCYGLPLATVHPDDPCCVDDMRQALNGGCIGLKIHENVQRLSVDDPRFVPVLDMVSDCSGIVLLHLHQESNRAQKDPAPERVERILKRHPDLKLLIAHLGGRDALSFMRMTERYPNLWLDTTWVFGLDSWVKAQMSDELLESYSHRLVYGTDFPLTPYPYDTELEVLRARKLSAVAQARLFHDNAAMLLKPFLGAQQVPRAQASRLHKDDQQT